MQSPSGGMSAELSVGYPAAVHAPGGQLVQATDQWVGVRNARIVLIDSEGVRAPVVAGWLKQLGCEVYVLEEGNRAKLSVPTPSVPALPALHSISATRVTVLAMLEPVLAALVAFAWLGEELTGIQAAGCLLVLAGVAIAETARPPHPPVGRDLG